MTVISECLQNFDIYFQAESTHLREYDGSTNQQCFYWIKKESFMSLKCSQSGLEVWDRFSERVQQRSQVESSLGIHQQKDFVIFKMGYLNDICSVVFDLHVIEHLE